MGTSSFTLKPRYVRGPPPHGKRPHCCPTHHGERRVRVSLDEKQVAAMLERLELAEPLLVHPRVHIALAVGSPCSLCSIPEAR